MTSSDAGVSSRAAPLGDNDPRMLGSYTLLGKLGQGGMGTVYLGRNELGRAVAIKVVRADVADDPQFRERFRQEAATARRVARVCTAEVLDFDPDAAQPYLVTEFIEGPTLQSFVAANGPLADANLEQLAVGVAAALRAIHAAGIVHRDLKPSNVVLSPFGPRVIDFGIARALDSASNLTGNLQALGTPAFMSPEQITGGAISSKADIWAWGGLVTYAATGQYPFGTGSAQALLYRALNEEPRLDGVDPALRPIVWDAMRKNPAERPTASQLMDRLLGSEAERQSSTDEAVTQVLADWRLPLPAGGATLGPGERTEMATLAATRPGYEADTELATRLAGGPVPPGAGPAVPGQGTPGGYPPAGPGQPGQPGKRRRAPLLIGAAVVAVLAVVAALVGVLASGGDDGSGDDPSAFLPRSAEPLGLDQVVFAVQRPGDSSLDLAIARIPEGEGPFADEKKIVSSPADDHLPVITPDRRTVIYTVHSTQWELWAVAADGSGQPVQLLTEGPARNLSVAPDARASVSPEGKFLVIRSTTDETGQPNTGLYIVAMDGSSVRRLDTKPQATDPAWSPDGERIAYWSNETGGDRGFLVLIPAAPGGEPVRLFPQEEFDAAGHLDADPAWSPDGKLLAFSRMVNGDPARLEVYVADVNTKQVTEITQEPGDDQDPVFAPRGSLLLFTGERGAPGERRIYVTDFRNPRNPDRELTPEAGSYRHVKWSAG
ncbi:MAG: serine/threonine-protein kinase [Frankia sp.]|nr:serine/threonine-protein kinase [Frankia sp.]